MGTTIMSGKSLLDWPSWGDWEMPIEDPRINDINQPDVITEEVPF